MAATAGRATLVYATSVVARRNPYQLNAYFSGALANANTAFMNAPVLRQGRIHQQCLLQCANAQLREIAAGLVVAQVTAPALRATRHAAAVTGIKARGD